MPIPSYVDFDGLQSTSVASLTPDIATFLNGNSPQDGDLLLAHLYVEGVSATAEYELIQPNGWHRVCSAQNANTSAIFWKIWRTGDDTTPTFSGWPTGDAIVVIHLIRGADQARPIVRHSINRENNDLINWLSETTPVANCLALATAGMADNKAGQTPASGWTERTDTDVGSMMMYAQTQGFASASSSTGNPVVDTFGSDPYVAHMLLIQEPQTPTPRDIRVKTGSSTSPTSTGNQDITGLGFDVKALIVYIANKNTDSVSANIEYMRGIGADDGVTTAAQRSAGVWHTSGGTADQGYSDNGSIVKMYFQGNTTLGSPNLQAAFSRITDGFRLNWTAVQGSGVVFNWIAIGGDDVEAVVGAEQASTSPVSGLPWRPDMVHTLSQCIDSDSDQIRDIGLLSAGWLDCQAGAQWAAMVDLDAGEDMFIVRHMSFIGQAYLGALTWEASFQQTTSDGWSWDGSNTDYFWYLALHFQNDTAFPFQVESLDVSSAGSAGDDEVLPSFADGQTFGEKQVVHAIVCDGGNAVTQTAGGISEGHVEFDGGSGFVRDQDVLSNARTGNTSERNRKLADAFLIANTGDLNSPAKIGRFTDEDTIDWSTNTGGGYIAGLATIGFIGQEYARTSSDSVAVTDQVAVEMFYGQTVSDAIAVTDQVAAEMAFERSASDTVEVTDAVTVEMTYGRTISDSVLATDAIAREATFERIVSDVAEVTDQIAREAIFERSATDAIAVTDQLDVEFTEGGVKISDTIEVTDQLTVEMTYERSLSDAIDVVDEVNVESRDLRTVSDTIAVTDQLTAETNYSRTQSDTVAVADALTAATEYARAVNDAVAVTDQLATEVDYVRTVGDAIAVVDALTAATNYARAISDAVDVTDQLTASTGYAREASDTIEVTDQLAVEMTYERAVIDTVAVIDQLQAATDYSRTVTDAVSVVDQVSPEVSIDNTDTVAVADQLATELTYSRTASDAVAVTDALTAATDYARTISDTAAVTDLLTADLFTDAIQVTVNDSVAVTDALAAATEYARAVADAVVVVDQVAAALEYSRVLADAVAVTDALTAATDYARAIADAVAVADAVQASLEYERTLADSVGVTDALAVEMTYSRTAVDAVAVTDALTAATEYSRSIVDTVDVTDAVAVGEIERSISDTVDVTDLLQVEVSYARSAVDAIGVTDQLTTAMEYARAVVDSIDVTDSIQADLGVVIDVTDTIDVTDQLIVEVTFDRTVSDAIDVTDQIAAVIGEVFDVTINDAISVVDQLQAATEYARTISDAVDVTDQFESVGGTLNVVITDTISVTDQIVASKEVAKLLSDTVDVVDNIEVELTLGAYASDTIDVTDQLKVEVWYAREASDAVGVEDQLLEGDPVLVVHSIDGGATAGPADIHTVSPDGPLTISGEPDCVTAPVGFVVELADTVECTDRIVVGLICEVVINDSVEVVG